MQKNKPAKPVAFKKPTWWNAFNLESLDRYSATTKMVIEHAVDSGQTVYSGSCKGVLENADDQDGFEIFLRALVEGVNGNTYFAHCPIFGRGETETWVCWDTGALTIRVGLDRKISVHIATLSREAHGIVGKVLGEFILPENVRQPVYALAEGTSGIEIMEVGLAGSVLERDNYEKEVLEGYDQLVSELQLEEPLGRLALLYGEPGCGKTYMIRGLLDEVPNAIFVLIPSHLVEDLAGPQLVPMLIRARSLAGTDSPIVLVIEDADKALVPREEGSLAAISALLNVSDGILGHSLNLRVVCTTNATLDKIDSALNRAGRLSVRINIGLLSPERCAEVFERVMDDGTKGQFTEPMALAEVYRFAKAEQLAESADDTDETEDDTLDDEEEDDTLDEDDDDTLDDDDDDDDDDEVT